MNFLATCRLGLEAIVAAELRKLKINVVEVNDALIRFCGDEFDLGRCLLFLRTAERVLLEVGSFPAKSFEALFDGVAALNWKQYIPRDAKIHVTGKSAKSGLFSVSDCQRITKKAIVENLRRAYKTKLIPETGSEIIIEVALFRDVATLALDACGAGLSRRGYRIRNVEAPLSETLGAGLLLLSQYSGAQDFLDPMCGSGTLPIEAALIAKNQAPGLQRSFAAEAWSFLNKNVFTIAREEAQSLIVPAPAQIEGSDIDPKSIELCSFHAQRANVNPSFKARPLRELQKNSEAGILVVNPPYGERLLEKESAQQLYKQMREVFKRLPFWGINIFSSHLEFERIYGKRADKRRKLSSGGKPCMLYRYFPGKYE